MKAIKKTDLSVEIHTKIVETWSVGDKVHYQPEHYKKDDMFENGIIKSIRNDLEGAFVVYNCGGMWNDYENYTAASTSFRDLKKGWK